MRSSARAHQVILNSLDTCLRVLDEVGREQALQRLVLAVDVLVAGGGADRRIDVEPGERVERVTEHRAHELAEVAEVLPVARHLVVARDQVDREASELLGLVADALEIGDDLDDGDDEAKVGGGRLAPGEHLGAVLVDLDLERVDLVIVLRDDGPEIGIGLEQRRQPAADLLLDEPAHLQHLVADLLELEVELVGDVLIEVKLVHGRVLV